MIAGRRVLAVVPARSGSKGIPDKNVQLLDGCSLLGWAGRTLRACPSVDRAIVSTDSRAYAAEAERHGLAAPFLRPPDLSRDTSGAVETMIHALEATQAHYGERYDVVLIVEPTCPLRVPADIEGALGLLVEHDADSVVTVSRLDSKYHPHKILKVDHERLSFYDPAGKEVVMRQTLSPLYYRNGACYAIRSSCLVERRVIISENTRPYVIDRPLVNIDTPEELEMARLLMSRAPLAPKASR